jgi:CBS domain-containing protein
MIPASKVVTVSLTDTIGAAIDAIVKNHISSVLVMNDDNKPVGIVTKTDLVTAYQQGRGLSETVAAIMQTDVKSIQDTMSRDDAAKLFERNHIHHAIVVNQEGTFVGMASTWDIASECAKDSRAWPWIRSEIST